MTNESGCGSGRPKNIHLDPTLEKSCWTVPLKEIFLFRFGDMMAHRRRVPGYCKSFKAEFKGSANTIYSRLTVFIGPLS